MDKQKGERRRYSMGFGSQKGKTKQTTTMRIVLISPNLFLIIRKGNGGQRQPWVSQKLSLVVVVEVGSGWECSQLP